MVEIRRLLRKARRLAGDSASSSSGRQLTAVTVVSGDPLGKLVVSLGLHRRPLLWAIWSVAAISVTNVWLLLIPNLRARAEGIELWEDVSLPPFLLALGGLTWGYLWQISQLEELRSLLSKAAHGAEADSVTIQRAMKLVGAIAMGLICLAYVLLFAADLMPESVNNAYFRLNPVSFWAWTAGTALAGYVGVTVGLRQAAFGWVAFRELVCARAHFAGTTLEKRDALEEFFAKLLLVIIPFVVFGVFLAVWVSGEIRLERQLVNPVTIFALILFPILLLLSFIAPAAGVLISMAKARGTELEDLRQQIDQIYIAKDLSMKEANDAIDAIRGRMAIARDVFPLVPVINPGLRLVAVGATLQFVLSPAAQIATKVATDS